MIRQFQPGDARACFDLIYDCIRQDARIPHETRRELIRHESRQSICQRASLFYMAVHQIDDAVVAVGGLDMNEIRLLFVSPDHQGAGIGRALLQFLEAMVPPALFSDVFVYSTLSAERFYRRCGYESRGEHVFDIHGQPLPTVFMVKNLNRLMGARRPPNNLLGTVLWPQEGFRRSTDQRNL